MEMIPAIVMGGAGLLFILWLIGGQRPAAHPPDQARRVGTLTGLLGGSIEDAAKAQYALRSLEEKTGQPPSPQDLGTAVGMQSGATGQGESSSEPK